MGTVINLSEALAGRKLVAAAVRDVTTINKPEDIDEILDIVGGWWTESDGWSDMIEVIQEELQDEFPKHDIEVTLRNPNEIFVSVVGSRVSFCCTHTQDIDGHLEIIGEPLFNLED